MKVGQMVTLLSGSAMWTVQSIDGHNVTVTRPTPDAIGAPVIPAVITRYVTTDQVNER